MAGRIADLARLAVFAGVIVAPALYPPGSSLQLAFAFAVLVGARHVALPEPLDLALCAALGLAVWASVAGWYGRYILLEPAVHLITTSLVAAMLYLVLAQIQLLPQPGGLIADHPRIAVALITTMLGLSAGVFWECFEWFVHWLPRTTLSVGFTDTIGDLAMDSMGGLLTGLVLARHAGSPVRPERY